MDPKRFISCNLSKEDAYQKVKGEAKYVADLGNGHLFARAVRSPYAHALIKEIRFTKALEVPGVVCVLTAKDIPGQNRIGMTGVKDQRVLAEDKVRFLGEAVAVVVGESEEACRLATKLVEVVYEKLPVVTDPEEALVSNAPLVGEDTNLCFHRRIIKGDFEQALAEADVIIQGEYRTGPVEHAYIEPEGTFAFFEEDKLHLFTTSKSAHIEQKEVARVLGVPPEKIRVTTATIGGSFGGKPDLPLDCMVSLAAFKTKRPVKMVYSREESIQVTTKRHSAVMRYTHVAKKDGTLIGVKLDMIADAGAYIDYSPTVLLRSLIGGAGPYRVPNVYVEVRGALTNNPPGGAMRGFGLPQVTFAIERQMDRLGKAVGLDPWEIRLKNCLVEGDTTSTGQVLKGVHIKEALEKARQLLKKEQDQNEETSLKPYEKRAWGVACGYYGNGRTGMPNPGVARAKLLGNGMVEIATGSPDIGQGSNTILKQIAAEALGIAPEYVIVVSGDTVQTPDSGTTSGTRVTVIVGKAVELVARELREKILSEAASILKTPLQSLRLNDGLDGPVISGPNDIILPLQELASRKNIETLKDYNPPTTPLDEKGQGTPYATYTYGTHCARIKVNTYTGKVQVERFISVYDVGTVINPALLTGQIEGAIAMGVGYALTEELQLVGGRVSNCNFDKYIIPTSLDMPSVYSITLDIPDHIGPFGAKGVGEPAVLPVAAAVANALSVALGVDVYNLPLNLEEVQRAAEVSRENICWLCK
ncbi:Aldehyde oxidase/xanthine dehydrogenase, a/b hammerhead [Moorella glycerini]|uniref:Xanthine dehydrogenase molybdenum-binding subunit n=1 Tax=Neomoorella stamsii TaxID=1266720 RepID=A0A9X7J370_9FIRM|nr:MULTISPECIES: xanthine dehydrogenase family protein molybdopterin-binding subunit [Moorella]PRR73430.1 Xanthine dehydrogenase molybdenum-binding subunit [Moorella stamsii]CEP69199.1 Aldehyde oxidase/xanthine dehydrogenase, a/b hammerhead [Moorella glycerini]